MSDTVSVFNIQKFSLQDGPGIRTAVFFSGCPLRCRWCANPESQQPDSTFECPGIRPAKRMTVPQIMAEVRKDAPFYQTSGGGLTLTGGEALTQPDGALALITAARAEGIHTCLETCCFAPPEVFQRVVSALDLALADLKHYDEARHIQGAGARLGPILENLGWLAKSGVPCRVRIPVIPGYNDAPGDARGFGECLSRLGFRAAELLPFHQFGEKKHELLGRDYAFLGVKPLRDEDLSAFAEILRGHGLNVRVGGLNVRVGGLNVRVGG